MGLVSAHLRRLLERQIEEHGLVVWYDDERHYAGLVAALELAETLTVEYRGSYYELRHRVHQRLEGEEPPRVLVYVAVPRADTHHALVELEELGTVVRPGENPVARNTRLAVVARHALRDVLAPDDITSIERQIDAGQLSLEELDRLGDEGSGRGVIALIFDTSAVEDLALEFLGSTRFDEPIIAKQALAELVSLLAEELDLTFGDGDDLATCRERLARHVLITELTTVAAGELPASISTVSSAQDPSARESCKRVARAWRLRTDLRDEYARRAREIAREFDLATLEDEIIDELIDPVLDGADSALPETFEVFEEGYQRCVVRRLISLAENETLSTEPLRRLRDLARARLQTFWCSVVGDLQARWSLVANAAATLAESARVAEELARTPETIEAVFAAYTRDESGWSELDRVHRHLERRHHELDVPGGDIAERLELLITRARSCCLRVASAVAETFTRAYRAARYSVPGVLSQRSVWAEVVKPALAAGKTAYVWVDALRFEAARELAERLVGEFDVSLRAALATPPTITEVGMAALLPGAEGDFAIETAARSKLAAVIRGERLKDRKGRLAYLERHAGCRVYTAKLEEFEPNPRKKLRDAAASAELILVTSQEIDQLGEEDNPSLARRVMDDVLRRLRRLFRIVTELGVETVVVVADHGYLFGDELTSDMKLPAPGGDTADLHRRVWVGRGGAASDSYLRAGLDEFGIAGGLEIATPWGFGCFKVAGGATAYFHGGLSPQEVIVPVLCLRPRRQVTPAEYSSVAWTLVPGSRKITTRFVSIQVGGAASGMFAIEPPRVRIEIRDGKDVVSRPVSASYGFDESTGEVRLEFSASEPPEIVPNTVALFIAEAVGSDTVSVHLVDSKSGAELERLSMAVEIAI